MLGLPLATLWLVWGLPNGTSAAIRMLDYELVVVRSDALGRLFAIIFSLMAFAGGLFALRQKSVLELVAAMVYAGSAVGVALAGDLITLFVFWEIMALASSSVLIAAGGEPSTGSPCATSSSTCSAARCSVRDTRAPRRHRLDRLERDRRRHARRCADPRRRPAQRRRPALLGLAPGRLPGGVAQRHGVPLRVHHQGGGLRADPSFPGTEILVSIGLFMIFYGIIYALLENDMRRILAYSIVNQVGFMVCGVGIGTEMALNGAAAHAFAHIIYKALLLMSAGAVLYMTGKRKCTDLGGLFQSMPVTTVCGIVGALAISSFPWTSGFVSKSMISQAAGDEHLALAGSC